jgi:hypothetical protein
MSKIEFSVTPNSNNPAESFLRMIDRTPITKNGFTYNQVKQGFISVPSETALQSLEAARTGKVQLMFVGRADSNNLFKLAVVDAIPAEQLETAGAEGQTLAHT